VSDLVNSYNGILTIKDAEKLAGAEFILEFNYNDKK